MAEHLQVPVGFAQESPTMVRQQEGYLGAPYELVYLEIGDRPALVGGELHNQIRNHLQLWTWGHFVDVYPTVFVI